MEEKKDPMTDVRWEQLKDRTWFGDEQAEVGAYVEALHAMLVAAEATAEREFIANQGLRAKARRQRVELERLNVHLAAARWACVQRYSAEQLVLALAGLRADNTKLRRDRDAGRRWVAVGSEEEVQELNRLERALAAAEKALREATAGKGEP